MMSTQRCRGSRNSATFVSALASFSGRLAGAGAGDELRLRYQTDAAWGAWQRDCISRDGNDTGYGGAGTSVLRTGT